MNLGSHWLQLAAMCLLGLNTLAGGHALAQVASRGPADVAATAAGANDAIGAASSEFERLEREQQDLLVKMRREIALLPPPDPKRPEADQIVVASRFNFTHDDDSLSAAQGCQGKPP